MFLNIFCLKDKIIFVLGVILTGLRDLTVRTNMSISIDIVPDKQRAKVLEKLIPLNLPPEYR